MNENETKLDDFEAKNESSDVILFSDYEPSDILGIVRVLFKTMHSRFDYRFKTPK